MARGSFTSAARTTRGLRCCSWLVADVTKVERVRMPSARARSRRSFHSRFGVLFDGAQRWGYLHVREDELSRSWPFGFRKKFVGDLLVEEFFRTTPPAPDDIDWADELGWSDTWVMHDDIPEESSASCAGRCC
jgi:hypothetical protein